MKTTSKTITPEQQRLVDEAFTEIQKGIAEIIDEAYMIKLLERYYTTNTPYLVKAGFDPTATDLHLGHTVLLQKLATFQKYGGHIQFLIGNFTALIGDPTGKSETRKMLDKETILRNAKTYQEQVFKILNPEQTSVVFNNDWLAPLGASGLLHLSTQFTVARMMERDDFEKRFKANTPIAVSEFLYPLLQGYDSVHLESDIEIGGTDQKFNLLMGRHLQRAYGKGKQQSILLMPILEGLDGVQKMSKSLKNFIAIKEDPKDMFAKIMSISDELMWKYYDLISDKSTKDIERLKQEVDANKRHPKTVKEDLGIELVQRYHSDKGSLVGEEAKEEFNRIFSQRDIPTDIPTATFDEGSEGIWLIKALCDKGLVSSSSEGRRLVKQGAIKVNDEKITDEGIHLSKGRIYRESGQKKIYKIGDYLKC